MAPAVSLVPTGRALTAAEVHEVVTLVGRQAVIRTCARIQQQAQDYYVLLLHILQDSFVDESTRPSHAAEPASTSRMR